MGTLRVSALRGGRVDNEEGFTFDDDAEPVVWAGLQGSVNASAACDDEDVNLDLDFDRVGTVAKRAVLSAALATSLTSEFADVPHNSYATLPESVPIVRTLDSFDDDDPDTDEEQDEEEEDEASERRRRLLELLKMLAIAVLIALTLLVGALKGCASCTAGSLVAPPSEEEQEEQAEEEQASDEQASAEPSAEAQQ